MYYWEWRRRFRQYYRNWRPLPAVDYKSYTKRRMIISFIFFFIGWKGLGLLANEKLFWRYDEKIGKMRMYSPKEMRELKAKQAAEELDRAKAQQSYPLDD